MAKSPDGHNRVNSPEVSSSLTIRPFQMEDLPSVVALAQKNFNGPSYQLLPPDVVDAYRKANDLESLTESLEAAGTEAYTAQAADGNVKGFLLLRYNAPHAETKRRNTYGEMDLRRIHVDPDTQGQGVGSRLLDFAEQRAQELHVDYISTHASGSSRDFFERNGWEGHTVLNSMKPIPAIVYAAHKRIAHPQESSVYRGVSEVVYAGSNQTKLALLRSILKAIPVSAIDSEESPVEDVVEAARSKVYDAARQSPYDKRNIAIVGVDVRTDLLATNTTEHRYHLDNRGKPKSLEQVQENFRTLATTSEETGKPAPYIVRNATYLHNPQTQVDTWSERDVTIWLSEDATRLLSTPEGVETYRQEVLEQYGADIMDMAAGFALPYFIEKGYVVGINGHAYEDFRSSQAADSAIKIVLGSPDEKLLRRNLQKI